MSDVSPPSTPSSVCSQSSKRVSQSRYRAHVFTINNYSDSSIEAIQSLRRVATFRYYVFGREKGESGTPHLQGYVCWKQARSFRSVLKLLPGAHVAIAKGDAQQNRVYCSKEGDFEEYGQIPIGNQAASRAGGQAVKDKWDNALRCAKSGDISSISSDLVIRYYSTIKRISADFVQRPGDRESLDNKWFYGGSGTGKSSHARKLYPLAYTKNRTKWWDGFQGQPCVIIDDVDTYCLSLGGLIKDWSDHYPFAAEVKCGTLLIRPDTIVVTSQYQPEEIWDDVKTVEAIRRRFKFTIFRSGLPPSVPSDSPPPVIVRSRSNFSF